MTLRLFSRRLFQSGAPFSHVVVLDSVGYVSGLVGQRSSDGMLVADDAETQTMQALKNLKTLLDEIDVDIGAVVRTTVYLIDYADFDAINRAYKATFSEPYPARTTLQVTALPLGARFQIDAIVEVKRAES